MVRWRIGKTWEIPHDVPGQDIHKCDLVVELTDGRMYLRRVCADGKSVYRQFGLHAWCVTPDDEYPAIEAAVLEHLLRIA